MTEDPHGAMVALTGNCACGGRFAASSELPVSATRSDPGVAAPSVSRRESLL